MIPHFTPWAATGLNFRDVLNVMGLYPGDPGDPGSDFAGVIHAVGEGVDTVASKQAVAWLVYHSVFSLVPRNMLPLGRLVF